jgi:hypothetical protein
VANPNPRCPEDKALRELFLSNVHPFLLREELKQKYCPNFNVLRKRFMSVFIKNYATIRDAAALSGRTERGALAGAAEAESWKSAVVEQSYGPTVDRLKNPSVFTSGLPYSVSPTTVTDIICHGRGKPGHYKNVCPQMHGNELANGPSPVRPLNLSDAYAAGTPW